MEASEIRLGNSIQLYRKPTDRFKTNHKVKQIGDGLIMLEDGFLVNIETGIEPIPLTEDWLVKFGFDKKDENTLSIGNFVIKYNRFSSKFYFVINGEFICVDTVHHLQNLYHAFYDKELTIKD